MEELHHHKGEKDNLLLSLGVVLCETLRQPRPGQVRTSPRHDYRSREMTKRLPLPDSAQVLTSPPFFAKLYERREEQELSCLRTKRLYI